MIPRNITREHLLQAIEQLDHNSFEGGLNTTAFKLLEREGFTIVEKMGQSKSKEGDHSFSTEFNDLVHKYSNV